MLIRPQIIDDDGTGQTGTTLDAAFFEQVFDYIDAKVEEATQAASVSQEAAAEITKTLRGLKFDGKIPR